MRIRLLALVTISVFVIVLGFAQLIDSGRVAAVAQTQAVEKGVPAQIAPTQISKVDPASPEPSLVQSMHLISNASGWALADNRLLFTTSFGKEWRDITPPVDGNLLGVNFLSPAKGWVVTTEQHSLMLGATIDGGTSWSFQPLLSPSGYEKYGPGDRVDVQFLDSANGWVLVKLVSGSNFSQGLLLRTSDGGNTWQENPNVPSAGRIHFTNEKDGWLVGGPQEDQLYSTHDSGLTWARVEIKPPVNDAVPAFDLPVFQNANEGMLPVTFTGGDRSVLAIYRTNNAGETWSFSSSLPVSEPLPAGITVPSATLPDALLAATSSDLSLTILKHGKAVRKTPAVATAQTRAHIGAVSFTSETSGWLLVVDGGCEDFKQRCKQTSRLFATNDGGASLTEITPKSSPKIQPNEAGQTDVVGIQSVRTSTHKGFDKCTAATVSEMQNWWTNSPYFDSNIYIGGVNRGCSQANLTSSWVSQVFSQGWGLIPTWVGPQATCTTCTTCSVMSSDPTTARSQGISEATSAANAASSLGLGTTIIYYDMERYNPNTSCQTAVRAFINGWVEQMHARGNLAGVYGSPQNAQEDWAGIANPPDAVWIAKWDGVVGVFGLTPLSDSFWVNSQRIHQYQGGHNETYGGLTFNIDNDFEDGPVAGSGGTPPTTVNLTPYQPSGWSDKIVVSNTTGTSTDSTLKTTDTLFIDWAVINNGTGNITSTFNEQLYVDGVQRQLFVTNPPLNANTFTFFQDFSLGSLSAGTHTIKIVADSGGVITETNEGDNEYTKTITVVTAGQPNLTPFQPSGWSDKIVVSNVTGTTTDTTLKTTDTIFVDWAEINNGTAATTATFTSRLLVDGVERGSWFTNPPLNVNSFAFVSDFSIGSLSAGSHTIRIILDSNGTISETNESDNEYVRTINITSTPSCFTLTSSASPGNGGSVTPNVSPNCSLGQVSSNELQTSSLQAVGPMTTNVVSSSGPGRAQGVDETFTRLIGKAEAEQSVRIIVGLNTSFLPEGVLPNVQEVQSQRQKINDAQSNLLAKLSSLNPRAVSKFQFIPYMAMEVDAATLRDLQNSPEVTSVEEDLPRYISLAESVPLIGGTAAWASGFTGAGQTVAILDTGVDKTHPFLAGKVVSEACYSTTDTNFTSVCPGGVQESTSVGSGVNCSVTMNSDCKHGTHVAGITAGKGASFSGVAKDATIIAIQVFSQPTAGGRLGALDSNMLKGLQRVQQLSGSFNIAAVNMSIGGGTNATNCDSSSPSLKAAIDSLRSVGIATVISSGNDSSSTGISYPACISSAISVGSTDDGSLGTTADQISSFSNSASILKLLAPGRWINSSVPGGTFENFSGTSMAAPHVTGSWAVLKSKAPSATVDQVLQALSSTGVSITDSRNGVTKPRIKVDAALNALGSASSGYSSGTVVTLTAAANSGFTFQGWTGCDSVSGSNCTVTMNTNRSVTASFQAITITRTLTVASSNPGSGVSVTVSPNDNSNLGSGATQFLRTYNNNTNVTLTAPSTAGGNNFLKWQRDSVDWSSSVSTSVTMDANHTMTAVYTIPPPVTRTLIVSSSNPNSGVFITVSPNDNGNFGSGSTQFTRTYNNNTNVTLTAPSTAGGNNFLKWQRDSVDWSTSLTTNVTMDANHTMTAVYTTTPTPITLSASPASVNPGGSISVTWTAPGNHLTTDWVGLYRTGTANSTWIDYKYVPGGSGGLLSFTAPATSGTYEFRYLPNNGFTSVATSNTVNVGGVVDFSISATPPSQTISPGGSTTFSVGTQTLSGGVQTIALGVSGLPSGATPSFNPPSVSSGNSSTLTITTTAAVSPGTYPLTITGNNSSTTHSTGVTLVIGTAGTASVTASPNSVSPGGAITVNWTAPANHATTDWVGLFKVGTANTAWLDYRYVPANVSGSFVFVAPSTSGSYEFRYLPNNGFVSIATSNPVTVGSVASDFSLSATPPTQLVKPGNSTSFSIGSATTSGNPQTITLGVTGLPSGASGSFNPPSITSGNSSTLNIITSAATPLGNYPLTITGTGTSAVHTSTVTLTVSNFYSLNATPEAVRPGNIITVTWFAPSGHSTTDWVGLYRPGAADTAFISFQYLNSGTFGGLNFTAPATEGGYEFRLYPNNGFTRAATSNTVAVSGAVTLIAIPGNVGPGASVSVQWSTTTMSAANDWIGLYAQGAPDTNFISFQYIGSAGTIGLKSFTMPSKNGAYEFRYFLTDTYAKAATSNTINVTGGTAAFAIDDLFLNEPALLQFFEVRHPQITQVK